MQCALVGVLGAFACGLRGQTVIRTDSSWGRTPATLTPSANATTMIGNRGTSYTIPGNIYTIAEAQGKVAGSESVPQLPELQRGQRGRGGIHDDIRLRYTTSSAG